MRESKIQTDFFVVEDEVAVTLSGAVAEELGLLKRVSYVEQLELYDAAKPYKDVFEGLGQLEGMVYHLKLKPGSQGAVKPARRIPIALQSKVKAELDRMETSGVIAQVTEPTEWASNMVVVTKGEKVRICLDPSDLNKALLREHYPMPTLEDIAPSISGAQYFTTLDAASGFWQIKLDEESSKICTMSTPYGRYRRGRCYQSQKATCDRKPYPLKTCNGGSTTSGLNNAPSTTEAQGLYQIFLMAPASQCTACHQKPGPLLQLSSLPTAREPTLSRPKKGSSCSAPGNTSVWHPLLRQTHWRPHMNIDSQWEPQSHNCVEANATADHHEDTRCQNFRDFDLIKKKGGDVTQCTVMHTRTQLAATPL
ncbi:uncharacterized protein LOC125941099 [Dermacentor silvarum]|uniref:uncharacterized protein LOC125941099 n=1 Tax=Dermacentor silvarum TaxID=543639 RepID=UPI002100931B|nr:uncharacterized protein LOC125941099 [Dermacentor silvarum]